MASNVSSEHNRNGSRLEHFNELIDNLVILVFIRCCGNDPFIFLRPRLRPASMHCIPGRADQLVFRSHVWFDRQYWE
jgi:hypothetical protein